MNALLVLYAGNVSLQAAEPLVDGKNSLALALERASLFPGVAKTVLLAAADSDIPIPSSPFPAFQAENRQFWAVKEVLDAIARHSAGFDLCYFAWADCPFLDPALAGKLAERHLRYVAEYSYADGWPYGLAPEILAPGTAAILSAMLGEDDGGKVRRDSVFSVIQKDINAFDIETEISSVDLRYHRLSLSADSKRNVQLLRRFAEEGLPDTAAVERLVAQKPDILRTLPAFFPVQVYGGCPHACADCPWPRCGGAVTERRDYLDARQFDVLMEKIAAFSGDAVIDLSLWGELSLHPQKMELIEMVLSRAELALVIETSGVGWKESELEKAAALAAKAVRRLPQLSPLSWIVSLDSADPERYKAVRGAGFAEANECARKLLSLFPHDAYVQAVRTIGAEDDIERFYKAWKETAGSSQVIIQKYDDFCGMLPKKQASDLSPVQRKPCWHLMRDMPILLDGSVPLCRQQIAASSGNGAGGIVLGNAFDEPLDAIWERGQEHYARQAGSLPGGKHYESLCAECDEHYTYNF